jgi:large subunit ribosomal protein L4
MELGALRSALSAKLRDGELRVVQAFTLQDHKTKALRTVLNKLEATKSVLVVDHDAENRNLALGSRNLAGVKLVATKDVNVYDLLRASRVLLSEGAARKLGEALKK